MDYEIIKKEIPYQGVFRLVRYQLRFRKFDGTMSKPVVREIFERRACVSVLLYDPERDQVVLVEQFRPGVMTSHDSPWLLEVVAGIIDEGESPTQTLIREAKEEANCDVLDLEPIYRYFSSPGGSNELMEIFCGRITTANKGIYGLAHEQEDIRTHILSAEEAFAKLKQGEIKTSPAIIALQWLQLNRERLKTLWLKK